mmetsp:Transcript_17899/g.51290  ORF Transcript_17899/g.51290 Transcript_17899/m.51290 type:complete len:201 (+) Transcript_17899:1172-1774(+)
MSTLDEHSLDAHLKQLLGPCLDIFGTIQFSPQQSLGFELIGRQYVRLRKHMLNHGLLGSVVNQFVSRGGDHDGIQHDKGRLLPVAGSGFDLPKESADFDGRFLGPQHPNLDGTGWQIVGQHIELLAEEFHRKSMDAGDAAGILGREAHDGRAAVASHGVHGVQIGLDAGTSAGIGTGDGVDDGWRRPTGVCCGCSGGGGG